MAERQKGFGLTKEISDKLDAKYSIEGEREIVFWMDALINEKPPSEGRQAFQAWLKDGQVLCRLMNALKPESINKVHNPANVKLAAMRKNKEMENISFFLNEAEKYGVGKADLFQTVDLFEDQNMAQVQTTLYKLNGVATKKGHCGPQIGVKESNKNAREFDEQKLREGRNIIGLQMGTNKQASQGGMTPYGLGRQLTPQSK